MKIVSRISATCILGTFLLLSCEDVINPELQKAEAVLVVDAWLNNKPQAQVINLMKTKPYFESSPPPGVSGAVVTVEDSEGNVVTFVEDDGRNGVYIWKPSFSGETFGEMGREYKLVVLLGGETFESTSYMGRVPSLDSITFEYEEKSPFYSTASYTAEFWAKDFPGEGDTYQIKTIKNKILLNKPEQISLAFDGGFSRGASFDSITFIPPIRTSINPFVEDENGGFLSPYVPGDSVYVEIHSISNNAFDYLNEVIIQTNRPGGFAELFSSPLSNVSTNIVNRNPNGSQVVGFFNVAAVSGLGVSVKEQ